MNQTIITAIKYVLLSIFYTIILIGIKGIMEFEFAVLMGISMTMAFTSIINNNTNNNHEKEV